MVEVEVLITHQPAMEIGFKGSQNRWEQRLRIRG